MAHDMKRRWILLDRDGVINEAVRDGYVLSEEGVRLLPGVAAAIARLNRHGFEVLVISNQQCVGKGTLAPAALDAITRRLCDLVAEGGGRIRDVFYCPHLAADGCACRKPKPGLVLQARDRYGFDVEQTYLVGDSFSDLSTAQAAGCPAIFVLSGLDARRYEAGEALPCVPECVVQDLAAAAAYVVEHTP